MQAREEGAAAVISVSDNGIGIPEELLPQVFELFVQSTRSMDRSEGGLGIGLSVVARLVDMHGGTVTASSPGPGKGATFEIRLPRHVMGVSDTEVAAGEHVRSGSSITSADPSQIAAGSSLILIRPGLRAVSMATSARGCCHAGRNGGRALR